MRNTLISRFQTTPPLRLCSGQAYKGGESRITSMLRIVILSTIIVSSLFWISCGGGGGGKDIDVTLTPTLPSSLKALSNIESVGSVRDGSDATASIVAGPATGESQGDGNYLFQMKEVSSFPSSVAFLWVNFYYTPAANTGQSLKDESSPTSYVVASLILQINSGSVTASENDFDTSMDDDADGIANLDEVTLGLNPSLSDTDGDGVPDGLDAFPSFSAEWGDLDGDGVGDNSDPDIDGDGLSNSDEALYGTDPRLADTDGDAINDLADNCRLASNDDQRDTDADGRGDLCEDDADGDGLPDSEEANYGTNPLIADTDGDGLGDRTEINIGTNPLVKDTDGDGKNDGQDNCPRNANANQLDTDGDGKGDACDIDSDNDSVMDTEDNCPTVVNPDQSDIDDDDIGDACDPDIDGDGVPNESDTCPRVSNPAPQSSTDADSDSVKIECDLDDSDSNIGAEESGIFVDVAHGSDSNAGTVAKPFASISAAITKAKAQGKKIYAAAGIYDVSNVAWQSAVGLFGGFQNGDDPLVRFDSRNVRSSSSIYKTLLTRGNADVTLNLSDMTGLVIGGFHIENTAASADPVDGSTTIRVSGGSVTLDRNTIAGNSNVTRSTALSASASANVALTRNFINGGGKDAAGSTSVGLSFDGASGSIINNIVKAGSGRFVKGMALRGSSPLIVNNTVDARSDNAAIGTAEGILIGSSSPVMVNNLILTGTAPDQYVIECEGSAPTSSAMFKNNLLAVFPQATGNPLARDCDGMTYQSADFVMGAAIVSDNIAYTASNNVSDLIAANYSLVGSRGNDGVDDGLDASGAQYGSVAKDYNGTARPRGAAYDIGAIEK